MSLRSLHLTRSQWATATFIAFVLTSALVAAGVYSYLSVTLQMQTGYSKVDMRLPEPLPVTTQIHGGQDSYMTGVMKANIPLSTDINTALRDRYPVKLKFRTDIPMNIRIDHDQKIPIDQMLHIETTTELVRLGVPIPDLPLVMDIPVKFDVPFSLHKNYDLVADVIHDDDSAYTFDEAFSVPVDQTISTQIDVDDTLRIVSIDTLGAALYNKPEQIPVSMDMPVLLPLKNLEPTSSR